MFVAWVGSSGNIWYSYGSPSGACSLVSFKWSAPAEIPTALTGAAPSIAELTTGPNAGRLYVFWKGISDGGIWYSSTPDPLTWKTGLTWAPEKSAPNTKTTSSPAAMPTGSGGPLLVAYKANSSDDVLYRKLSASGAWSNQHKVPGAQMVTGPGIASGILAATTSSGTVVLHAFR